MVCLFPHQAAVRANGAGPTARRSPRETRPGMATGQGTGNRTAENIEDARHQSQAELRLQRQGGPDGLLGRRRLPREPRDDHRLLVGPFAELLPALDLTRFDLVFYDGDHDFEPTQTFL